VSESFETTDIAVAEQLMRDTYSGHLRLEAHGPHGGMRVSQAQLSPAVRLDDMRFTFSYEAESPPIGVITIGHLRSGRASYRSHDGERLIGPGDVVLCFQPDQYCTVSCADLDIGIASIDPALLSRVADTAPGRRREPVRLTGYTPVTPQAARLWESSYGYAQSVAGQPGAPVSPLVVAATARLLAATALAVFPNNALTDPTIEDRRDAHSATLRRAIAFIDEHPHRDIAVADIAAAAYVSVRAVQLAFRRHLGTTPMAYLRRVRLDRAHRDLLGADPAVTTVGQIAARWGFSDHSRFTAAYGQEYGHPPSSTLRQD
jgi:AraC-like DNA-binding protein